MSQRTRFIPSGTPTPQVRVTDSQVPLNDTQAHESNTNERASQPKRFDIFSPAPKLNPSSLKKKSGSSRNRQHHAPRTLIIPTTVDELDETESGPNSSVSTKPGAAAISNLETVNASPKLSRLGSYQHPSGMPAPDDSHPPAYTPSYTQPPGFLNHPTSNIGILAPPHLSQTHIAPPSLHTSHPLAYARLSEIPASPHSVYANVHGPPDVSSGPLRSAHSQPPIAFQHHNIHDSGTFARPSTPAPRFNEREREKRSNTVESDIERDGEMELHRGRVKRSRLHSNEFNMAEAHMPYSQGNMNNTPTPGLNFDPRSQFHGHVDQQHVPDSDLSGINLDAYISAHMERFEEAKRKWSNCSLEEWKAGADEITNSFAALLSTVRSHMSTKLTLFATFDARCAQQMKEIEEGKKDLDRVRKEMENGAGGVVGFGLR